MSDKFSESECFYTIGKVRSKRAVNELGDMAGRGVCV